MNLYNNISIFLGKSRSTKIDQAVHSKKKFEDFFDFGKKKKIFTLSNDEINITETKISDWIKYGKKIRLLNEDKFNHDELDSLKGAFALCIIFLSSVIILSIFFTLGNGDLLFRIAFSGILGSSLTAFISCLNRRANGFEDSFGNSQPIANSNKEQFSLGMFNWLLLRPMLGLIAVFVFYWIKEIGLQNERLITIAFVSGLMAKTVINVFKEWPKVFLKI